MSPTIPMRGSRRSLVEAMAWVKERNAESTGELTRRSGSSARAAAPRDPRLRRADPGHPEARPVLLQLLAGCQEPAGPLAADHAGGVPQGQARLGGRARPRRPGKEEKENWVWHGARCSARVQARPGLALARRGRRQSSANSTSRTSRSSRTVTRCPRPRARSPGEG